MLCNSASLAIAALSAIGFMTQPAYGQNITTLPPPVLIPSMHIALKVEQSTVMFATNDIMTTQANNQGGTISGNITGTLLKLGTEYETYPTIFNHTESQYHSLFTINTTDSAVILMTVDGNLHYKLPVLHGFTRMTFSTAAAAYQYLNIGDYVAEIVAIDPSGLASVDIYELQSSGGY